MHLVNVPQDKNTSGGAGLALGPDYDLVDVFSKNSCGVRVGPKNKETRRKVVCREKENTIKEGDCVQRKDARLRTLAAILALMSSPFPMRSWRR